LFGIFKANIFVLLFLQCPLGLFVRRSICTRLLPPQKEKVKESATAARRKSGSAKG